MKNFFYVLGLFIMIMTIGGKILFTDQVQLDICKEDPPILSIPCIFWNMDDLNNEY